MMTIRVAAAVIVAAGVVLVRAQGPADHPSVVAGLTTATIKQIADLEGKKIGVVRGTTQDTDLTRQAKGAQLVRYEDDATMALAFASGQVDIIATARSLLPAISKDKQPQCRRNGRNYLFRHL